MFNLATSITCFSIGHREQPETTLRPKNLLLLRVALPSSPPAVDEGGDADDGDNGADDGGNGNADELPGGGLGFRGLREDEGGDVGRERSEGNRGRRRRRRGICWEKGRLIRGSCGTGKWYLRVWR